MASYGFSHNNKGWNESKKGMLARALRELVDDMEGEGKFVGLTKGQRPYILIDEPSRGVTIMNLSYLTKDFQDDLIKVANKKYKDIMPDEGDSEGYVLSNNISR
jgi:hypothetical protein